VQQSSQRPAQVVKVMIVDDSAVVRGLFTRWAGDQPDIVLVGSAPDGAQAVARLANLDPDVVVLDVEMPVMGGLEALPKLLAIKPGLRVVMASTLTQKGAEVTMRALSLGAADYIGKPESTRIGGADAYRDELFAKVRALSPRPAARSAALKVVPQSGASTSAATSLGSVTLRPLPNFLKRPEILAVGASTGGPMALREFFSSLDGDWRPPVVVVQHMPPAFTALLAEQLSKISPMEAVEAEHGTPLLPGRIHLARGDHHMTVRHMDGRLCLALDQDAPENFCRPAVDPLFRSVAQVFKDRVLAVVLTGMGQDGRQGSRAIVEAGGVVLAQDEASSVVWGMPGAVAGAGLASALHTVPKLAQAVRALGKGDRP
jgi:two-component system chemotaxis response regulator CheB